MKRVAGRVVGTIPGQALEVQYRRSGSQRGHYYHPFKPGVKMYALKDGSVLFKGRKRIHAMDTEPGFWEQYGHGRKPSQNPRGWDMHKLLKYAVIGGLIWYAFQNKLAAPSTLVTGSGGAGIPMTVGLPDGSTDTVVSTSSDGMILTAGGWQSMVMPSGAEQWVNVHTGAVMAADGTITVPS